MRFNAVLPPISGDVYAPEVAERMVGVGVTPTGGRVVGSTLRDDGAVEVTIEYDDEHPFVKDYRSALTEFSVRGSVHLPYDGEAFTEWVRENPREIAAVPPAEPRRDPFRAAVGRFFRRD